MSNNNPSEIQNLKVCDDKICKIGSYDTSVGEIYDILKNIVDPEKPQTLEELNVINEDDISIEISGKCSKLSIEVTPTVDHCSLAPLIGLSIRSKLEQFFGSDLKIDINLKRGTHQTADAINKQINDKERIAAAMENPNIKAIIEKCIADHE